ncbi:M20/M25/M40 family metallo-hydrolase [Achromobacter insuavis]
MIERRMGKVVAGTAAALGCKASLHFERCYPALVNDEIQTRFALDVMREVAGGHRVTEDMPRLMGSEDFAFMLAERPGCYVLLGNGSGGHRLAGHGPGPGRLHNPSYDFNDEIIPLGAAYFVRLVERYLDASNALTRPEPRDRSFATGAVDAVR